MHDAAEICLHLPMDANIRSHTPLTSHTGNGLPVKKERNFLRKNDSVVTVSFQYV